MYITYSVGSTQVFDFKTVEIKVKRYDSMSFVNGTRLKQKN